MDFTPTYEQEDVTALARQILADASTQPRLREAEEADARFDARLWKQLGEAGLLGMAVPEALGGAGLGILEACSVAIEVGRLVAPVPYAWHVASQMALAEFGTTEQQRAWVPDAVAGTNVLTVALSEDRADVPERPATTAERYDGGWRLSGAKTVVPSGTHADLFLVPADTSDGTGLFLVAPTDRGVSISAQRVNDGDAVARLELDQVELPADRLLGSSGQAATRWLVDRLTVLLCAQQVGVAEGAMELTSQYAATREQFGKPIGSFQAVSQRLADGYIELQGIRLTTWQAAWRLSENLPSDVEVATAKLWAADAGHRIAHTTVHVHGGVGIDLDGEAHRYFTAAKRLEFTLGGATLQARNVGRILAAEPA